MNAIQSQQSRQPFLRLKNVSKSFGHVQALDKVNLDIHEDEIVGLVGDNGAGKSTLVKILSGVYFADECEIEVDDKLVDIKTPGDAQSHGIATVYQDLALVDHRDVASNIYLGMEPKTAGVVIDRRKMWADAKTVIESVRTTIQSPKTEVGILSGGQRQAVAIARSLVRGSRLFIMDEPTAALGVEQSAMVLSLLSDLKQRGAGVLLISHNMSHVFDVVDRVVVLRHGKKVAERIKTDTSPVEIVGLITGAIDGELG